MVFRVADIPDTVYMHTKRWMREGLKSKNNKKKTDVTVESMVFKVADMNSDIPDAVYVYSSTPKTKGTKMGWLVNK